MQYIALALTLAAVHGISLISPGPDFFLVLRNSLMGSKRLGRITALGIVLGNVLYVTMAVVITFFVNKEVGGSALTIVKLFGGLYLGYLGCKIICFQFSKDKTASESRNNDFVKSSDTRTFWMGFASTALNGKAAVYFLSIVPQFINPQRVSNVNIFLFMEFVILSGLWFFTVAEISGYPSAQSRLKRLFPAIDAVVGAVFTLFAILLLFDFAGSILWVQ